MKWRMSAQCHWNICKFTISSTSSLIWFCFNFQVKLIRQTTDQFSSSSDKIYWTQILWTQKFFMHTYVEMRLSLCTASHWSDDKHSLDKAFTYPCCERFCKQYCHADLFVRLTECLLKKQNIKTISKCRNLIKLKCGFTWCF